MIKKVRTATLFVVASSSAWASAGLLTFGPITALPTYDYAPINYLPALVIGAGIASMGYLPAFKRTSRDWKLLAPLAAAWAGGWVLGSVAVLIPFSRYLFEFIVHRGTWYPLTPPLPQKVLVEVAAALPRYAAIGGTIGGLILGIGQWLATRHTLRLSWLLIPAAIIGWAAGWWLIASMYANFALDFVSELMGLGSVFWLSRMAIAGGVAGLSSGLVIALLPRFSAQPLPSQNSYRDGPGEEV